MLGHWRSTIAGIEDVVRAGSKIIILLIAKRDNEENDIEDEGASRLGLVADLLGRALAKTNGCKKKNS